LTPLCSRWIGLTREPLFNGVVPCLTSAYSSATSFPSDFPAPPSPAAISRSCHKQRPSPILSFIPLILILFGICPWWSRFDLQSFLWSRQGHPLFSPYVQTWFLARVPKPSGCFPPLRLSRKKTKRSDGPSGSKTPSPYRTIRVATL